MNMLSDDVETVARRGAVTTQQPAALLQRLIVGPAILVAKCLAPIAAMVTAEVAGQIHIQRKRTGGGVNLPKWKERFDQMEAHGDLGVGG